MSNNTKQKRKTKRPRNKRGNTSISVSGNSVLPNSQTTNKPARLYAQTISQFTSGPIPNPELLEKYNEIIPDGADRIMKMAETQSKHRQNLETVVITGGNSRANLGVVFAFVFAMTIALVGGTLIYFDKTIQGMIFAGVGLTGIVYLFIYGTRSQKEERQRRDTQNRELTRK